MTFAAEFVGVRWPALGGVLLGAIVVGVLVAWWRRRHHEPAPWTDEAPIANVPTIADSPVLRRRWRRYQALARTELVAAGAVAAVAGLLLMRPLGERADDRADLSRDVELCLDVSGSMKELDESILRQFEGIANGLPGDRVGLTIWNASAITVFPLTDDAGYVDAMLGFAVDQLNRGARSFVLGTEEGGSSLIGDGLASCVLRFDRPDEERARSIIFATDNKLAGDPLLSLTEAAALARQRGIRVYAVAAADTITDDEAAELRAAAESTGGAYVTTDDEQVVDAVIAEIEQLEADHLEQPPEIVRDDRPHVVGHRRAGRDRRLGCGGVGVAAMSAARRTDAGSGVGAEPLVPLALIGAFVVLVVVIALGRWRRGAGRWALARFVIAGLLAAAIMVNPTVAGGRAERESAADVLFVVDTTASMAAEDYDGDRPRARRRAGRHRRSRRGIPGSPLLAPALRLAGSDRCAVDHRRGGDRDRSAGAAAGAGGVQHRHGTGPRSRPDRPPTPPAGLVRRRGRGRRAGSARRGR